MILKKVLLFSFTFSFVSLFPGGLKNDSSTINSVEDCQPTEAGIQDYEFTKTKDALIKQFQAYKAENNNIDGIKNFDWSGVDEFLNMSGKKLSCKKINLAIQVFLTLSKIDPVKKFKETIEKDSLLKEAMVNAVVAAREAVEILHEMAVYDYQDAEKIAEILQSKPFSCAKRGINLILRALLELGHQKKYFDNNGKFNDKGRGFMACVKGIIRYSIDNSPAKSKVGESNILTIFEEIKGDKASFNLAIAKLDEFWTDPKNIIKLIFEIKALTVDLLHDIPSLSNLDTVRSTDEIFDACEKMLEEKMQASHR